MAPLAMALSDQDIADIAAYYSAQKPKIGQTRPENLETGAHFYRAGDVTKGLVACMACHGPTE